MPTQLTTTPDGELVFEDWPTVRGVFTGHSADAITYLVPVIGPSAAILLHHVSRRITTTGGPYQATPEALSHACGGGPNGGRLGLIAGGLERLVRFGYARTTGEGRYQVRTQIPGMPVRQVAHLPIELQRTVPVIT